MPHEYRCPWDWKVDPMEMEQQAAVGWVDIAAGIRTSVLCKSGLTTGPALQPSHPHHLKRSSHLVYFVCLVPRGKEGIRLPKTRVTH